MSPKVALVTMLSEAAPSECLLSTAINLSILGVNVGVLKGLPRLRLQEQLSNGDNLDLPVQFELTSPENVEGTITWLAAARPAGRRRFLLSYTDMDVPQPQNYPRVRVLPEPNQRIWLTSDGQPLLGYCYSPDFPKPFFYPINGPCGQPLTRLGHPRDQTGGHDHHRSLWVEHEAVNHVSFETEYMRYFQEPPGRVVGIGREVHRAFTEMTDGPVYAALAMRIDWVDYEGKVLIEETRRIRTCPLSSGEQLIDLWLNLKAASDSVTFAQSTYGILAVRFASFIDRISGYGRILNAQGHLNEAECHLQITPWVDYAGPVTPERWNGVTILDHPENINHPPAWMTRDDGWMCPAPTHNREITLSAGEELLLRYRLFVHEGKEAETIASRYEEYAQPAEFQLTGTD